jgi:hypothetical protein
MLRPARTEAGRLVPEQTIPLQGDQLLAGAAEGDAEVAGDRLSVSLAAPLDMLQDEATALRQRGEHGTRVG